MRCDVMWRDMFGEEAGLCARRLGGVAPTRTQGGAVEEDLDLACGPVYWNEKKTRAKNIHVRTTMRWVINLAINIRAAHGVCTMSCMKYRNLMIF